ncbi:hypothetical protein PAXRUDRAFT_21905 [Paxillus rubicundulus Ve08.2h10]|uniref:Uncharacterized protein n=1 Tax=Paxillus rubicundulus Ve08.2h10 TaxID=930991 RepID=A0A0D0D6K6_9AGAM|nr:hypothetical protein PAXRUDRAFT_21905 [Paxillus rubicundulus Ve08.2h10]
MGFEQIYLAVERRYELQRSRKVELQTPMFWESGDTNSDVSEKRTTYHCHKYHGIVLKPARSMGNDL